MRYVAMLWDQTPPSEIIARIELLNRKLAGFWKAATVGHPSKPPAY
jgi:hypothetical protein